MTQGISSLPQPNPRILELAGWIYPQAPEFIQRASRDGAVKTCLYQEQSGQEGVFCLVEQEHFIVGYLAFSGDLPDWGWKEILKSQVESHLPDPPFSELCFNLYGRNPRSIEYVQSLGFRLDMHGLVMSYPAGELPALPSTKLRETGLAAERLGDYCALFDEAYTEQNQANGWKTDWYEQHSAAAFEKFSAYERANCLRSYWKGKSLVGVCLTNGPYLSDLVVHPRFQNQGYGQAILAHCVRRLIGENGQPEVRLRVALNNTGAIRLYRRFGFQEAGCFADHTYAPRKENFSYSV